MISLIVFVACLTAVNAECSCKPFESLKEAFCQSDFVLLATVKKINFEYGKLPANDTNTTDGEPWTYNIWHSGKTWKGPILAASVLSTPNSEDACGVPGLSENVEYFLTGKLGKDGEFTFTSCDFVMPSSDLAPQEYDLLMQLMWYPKKCEEKVDEKGVEGDENSVKDNDEKNPGGNDEEKVEEGGETKNDEKNPEGNDEEEVEEGGETKNDEKTPEGNDDEKVEEGGETKTEESDQEKGEGSGEKTAEGDDEEKTEGDNGVNDREAVDAGGEEKAEEDGETKEEESGEDEGEQDDAKSGKGSDEQV